MSNPPPVRPWFRLTSIRPVPTPAPEPRPSLPLPTFRTSSAPSSPHIHPTQQPQPQPQPQPQEKTTQQQPPSPPPRRIVSTSLPSSPLRKAPPLSSSSFSPPHKPAPPPISSSPEKKNSPITRVLPSPTPHQSPKTIRQSDHSPMHSPKSPKSKLSARPPSPLTLPPSQLKTEEPNVPAEAEPKAVLVQKTIDKPKTLHNNGGGEHHHRESRNHGNPHHGKRREGEAKERTKVSDSEDSGMRVITIAGENRGAYMELIKSPKKKESHYLHKKGNEHVKDFAGGSESSGAEEGNIKKKDKNQKGRTGSGSSSSFPMTAYMNSNVQCVNNSLLYHTSCSHHDPGVRLSLTKKPIGEGYYLKEHVEGKNN